MELLFGLIVIGSVAWLAYTFLVYPLAMWLVARRVPNGFSSATPCFDFPAVALVISAYNEQEVIARKLANALSLDYPEDRLSIWVSSDGSTDGTNAVVEEYARISPRIHLVAYAHNRGKTRALLDTLQRLPSSVQVVVFSDANSMYRTDALKMLVRHFHDPTVGCVAGELRYQSRKAEREYRGYENRIKRAQSALGVPVTAEGSIFAVRRELVPKLDPSSLEDMVIPLRVAAKGHKVVYEPRAVSEESFNMSLSAQWRRRFRITNRAVRALRTVPEFVNLFRGGKYAFHFVSHRVMRWGAPFALVGVLVGLGGLWVTGGRYSRPALAVLVGTSALGALGLALETFGRGPRVLRLAGAFLWHSSAILAGVVSAWLGVRVQRWAPMR
ncbi:MAG: hypothetical protein KatS3mg082_3219 [Nitrospiraceae bacterium]|nr:MAG: hypothetical protein KatS3mg082_3219 [Nitrospiraceae bacterium]